MKAFVFVVVTMCAGAILTACSLAQKAMPGQTMSDAEVLGVLNTINLSEIDAGQLAKERASSEEVRTFAARMVNEHQVKLQNTNQLAQRIKKRPETPALASALGATHHKTMNELHEKNGRTFEKAYMEYQISMHRQSVSLVQGTADSVQDPQFKRFLRQALPDLQNHLQAAQSVERQILSRK